MIQKIPKNFKRKNIYIYIKTRAHAFNGFASSYNVEILNYFNSELQLKATESAIKNKLKKLLTELTGFKFVTVLVLMLKMIESKDKAKFNTFYLNSKVEIIINESAINDVFQSIYATVMSNLQKYLGKVSGWIINSAFHHNIDKSKYYPVTGNSYIELPKELNHPRKGLINVKNIYDNECFKQIIVRYLHLANNNVKRIKKSDKNFAKKLYFRET